MKSYWWVHVLKLAATCVVAFSTYSLAATPCIAPCDAPNWFHAAGLWFKPRAVPAAFIATAVFGIAEFLQFLFGVPGYRKETVQRFLDVLVGQCHGRARNNRVTLFKRVSGFRAFWTGVWRLRWLLWRKSKRSKLRALWRIEWTAEYLMVYVRSSGSKGPNSTAAFRVSDLPGECEGIAGLVWLEDFLVRPNLSKLTEDDRKQIRALTMDQILRLGGNNRLRRYVEATGIKDIHQLRAIESFARHFMGSTVHGKGGRLWGVLLLDSDENDCPFSLAEPNGGAMGRLFSTQAETLSNVLR